MIRRLLGSRVAALLTTNAAKAIALMVFVFAMAIGSSFDLMYKVGYAMLFTIILCFAWTRLTLTRVRLERDTRTNRTQVGEAAEERFVLINEAPLPRLWIEVHDLSDLPGYKASHLVNFRGQKQYHWRVRVTCSQRGQYTLGPVDLETTDPFGLFRVKRRIPLTRRIVVYPETVNIPGFGLLAGALPGGAATRDRTHYVTPNVAGVREYAPGDSFNRIHWRSSARTGTLMVKQFEPDPTSDVWILLDMHGRSQAGSGLASTEEYSVTVAASLARHFINRGRAVGLLAYGEKHEVIPSDRGGRQMLKILDELAVVRANGRAPLAEVIAAEAPRFGRHSTIVIVTPSTDHGWIAALAHMRERGISSAVCLLETSTFGPAESSIYAVAALAGADIPTYIVKNGVPLAQSLSGDGQLADRGR